VRRSERFGVFTPSETGVFVSIVYTAKRLTDLQ
jgi:hypothetical protein